MSEFISTYDRRADIELMRTRASRPANVAPVPEVTPPAASEDSIRKEMERRIARRLAKPRMKRDQR